MSAVGRPSGPGRAASASLTGSTIAISRPPRITNWSIAYSAASDRCCAWATSSTCTSGSIAWASSGTFRTAKLCRSCNAEAHGAPAPGVPRAIIIARGSPSSGRDDMTPTTGRFGFDSS